MNPEHFSTSTQCLPHPQKPFRIAEYGAVTDGSFAPSSSVQLDSESAGGVAQRFNEAHDVPTDIYGLVISIDSNISTNDAGHFSRLEARDDGLYAAVTWLHGVTDILQGDIVRSDFSVRAGVINLESVEISRQPK